MDFLSIANSLGPVAVIILLLIIIMMLLQKYEAIYYFKCLILCFLFINKFKQFEYFIKF